MMVGSAKNPKKNGPGKEFYPNGKVMSEGPYMMNRKSGKFKEYHPNGKLMAEGEYMNNKRNGTWKFYNPDGSVDTNKSGYYMMGRLNKKIKM
jgi:antitoxin component YwqK of YwqJK toxin-antitoxin module